ncbi:MAG: hypothetical protein ACO3A2_02365 [Bdellovibrionia bacterium]
MSRRQKKITLSSWFNRYLGKVPILLGIPVGSMSFVFFLVLAQTQAHAVESQSPAVIGEVSGDYARSLVDLPVDLLIEVVERLSYDRFLVLREVSQEFRHVLSRPSVLRRFRQAQLPCPLTLPRWTFDQFLSQGTQSYICSKLHLRIQNSAEWSAFLHHPQALDFRALRIELPQDRSPSGVSFESGHVPLSFDGLRDFEDLQELDLSSAPLEPNELQEFSRILPELRQLKSLNLAGTSMTEAGLRALGLGLAHHPSLESLNLSRNPLQFIPREFLQDVLPSLKRLQRLELEDLALGQEDLIALAQSLPLLSGLRELSLSGLSLSVQSTQALAQGLAQVRQLKSLSLQRMGLQEVQIRALLGALTGLLHLETLKLGQNRWDSQIARVLSLLVIRLPSLKELDLSQNRLGALGARVLLQGLLPRKTIQRINLSCNQIDANWAQLLDSPLLILSQLDDFDLSDGPSCPSE